MCLDIEVPCYTTISRRARELEVELPSQSDAAHIVVDSTGLKVFGEGEWKTRQHGYSKRRTWRKLQLSINAESGEIVCAALTTNDVHDGQMLSELVNGSNPDKVYCDGAYDSHSCYEEIAALGAEPVIPPRRRSKPKQHGNCRKLPLKRDEVIRSMRKLGRKRWKHESGYHIRSLAETGMYRYKQIFGDKLKTRAFDAQAAEAFVKARALNIMTSLGMPKRELTALGIVA